jgi:signal transduction histidine kinase
VDLVALLRQALQELSPEDAARVLLRGPAAADTATDGDAVRLRQVLDNLLSNALKYAPAPTVVRITVEPEGENVHLQVADEGMGIAPDELPLLFQRYRRTRAAQGAGIAGAGLGLYLSRVIVEQHGGRIWATSPGVGQGTTLHVVLPRQPRSPSENAAAHVEDGAAPSSGVAPI